MRKPHESDVNAILKSDPISPTKIMNYKILISNTSQTWVSELNMVEAATSGELPELMRRTRSASAGLQQHVHQAAPTLCTQMYKTHATWATYR